MPVVNPLARELVFKVVYYGPGLGGKTTSLQHIHATAQPEHRGRLVSLATPVDRTLYFDFLPVRLPALRGMNVRLQLFTVPGQVYYNATRKLVLTGADGIVMVVDSQPERLDANLESLENLIENLVEHGRSLGEVPHVLQYNKRDLSGALPVRELDQKLNRHGVAAFPSIAVRGDGVYEVLESIARAVIGDFEKRVPARAEAPPELALPEGGLAAALRATTPPAEADAVESAPEPTTTAAPEVKPERKLGRPPPKPARGMRAARASQPDLITSAVASATPSSAPGSDEDAPFRPPTLPSMPSPELAARQRELAEVAVVDSSPRPVLSGAGVSFSALFLGPEKEQAEAIESALSSRDYAAAVTLSDRLASRLLASVASVLGASSGVPRDPALVVLLLGASGPRYLEFRSRVRDARNGGAIEALSALESYAFVIELVRARSRIL